MLADLQHTYQLVGTLVHAAYHHILYITEKRIHPYTTANSKPEYDH